MSGLEHAMAVAIEAQDAAVAVLRPGASGAEIDAIARDVCRRAGLERHFAYSGVHSVGLGQLLLPNSYLAFALYSLNS